MRQLEAGKCVLEKQERGGEAGREGGDQGLLFSPQFEFVCVALGVCCSDGVSGLPGS